MRGKLVLALLGVAACGEANNHLLEGQLYEPAGECLGPQTVIDDLAGPDPGDNCTPECITTSEGDASYVYVTTTCPPYGPQYTTELADAAHDAADPCVGAFVAYADGGICSGDAEAPMDAGADAPHDAEAGADSAADARPDAVATADAGTDTGSDAGADAPAAD